MAVAIDNPGLNLPPSASKGNPANRFEYFNPNFLPNFIYQPLDKFLHSCFGHLGLGLTILLELSAFFYTVLVQLSPLTCNLVFPKPSWTMQESSEKDTSSYTR